ncbi:MAG: M20 family metallopeptidase [Hyphomicrobiaceae bacterium]
MAEAAGRKLDPNEARITGWLAEQKPAMLALLEEVVNIDSGSYDKAGVDAVGERFRRFYESEGLLVDVERHESYGDAIHIRLDDQPSNEKPIVLMGHRDTVFPKGEAARRPFKIENGRAYGPGVVDMKGGLVLNAFVLAAFKRFGGNPVPLRGLITSDEEIASPACRTVIERVAREARCVLNSEPGRPSGNVVTGRKGGVFMRMEVLGKAAHSGGNFEKGISAIGEIAHKIVALHALTDLPRGITVNVGLVSGGQSVNTTAPHAEGRIDLRYVKPADREYALGAIRRIIDTPTVPGTTASFEILGEFLPLTKPAGSEELFATYVAAAADAGLKVAGEFSGGCADSGFTTSVGCPTICATGPVGGNAHTPEEYLEVESFVPRAQAMALAILRMPLSA